jgi:hypothetical protein
MLRGLKIEAYPALVNTLRRQTLAESEPSVVLFNHVLVQVIMDGQSVWLDPTKKYERGALALRSWANFGWGLTVAPNVTELTPIPPSPVQPLTTVTEYLNLGSVQTSATVKRVTVAEGADADRLRERFATMPREDLEREYLKDCAKYYPFIRSTAPVDYSDDEQQNRIETMEFYAIDKMWNPIQGESDAICRIYSVNVDDALMKPEILSRATPLDLPYPVHQVFHVEMLLTNALPTDPSNVTIQNPAFFFQRTAGVSGSEYLINYEYRSWTDALAPDAVSGYARDINAATAALGYKLIGQ